jgi:hypothetical protein
LIIIAIGIIILICIILCGDLAGQALGLNNGSRRIRKCLSVEHLFICSTGSLLGTCLLREKSEKDFTILANRSDVECPSLSVVVVVVVVVLRILFVLVVFHGLITYLKLLAVDSIKNTDLVIVPVVVPVVVVVVVALLAVLEPSFRVTTGQASL